MSIISPIYKLVWAIPKSPLLRQWEAAVESIHFLANNR